ncbi:hypothetical protein PM082_023245 [Marasmius tenuissimus]|nr:hypothetical protein PM082_023245 [Marasmius tenuissimus]
MLRVVLSDSLCAEQPNLITRLRCAVEAEGFRDWRVISDQTWLKDFSTVRWEGVAGKAAVLWLIREQVVSVTTAGGILSLVEEFRQVHRQVDRSQQTWILLYGLDSRSPLPNQEHIDLQLILAQFVVRIHVIHATDEDDAICKLMSISKVLSESLHLLHGDYAPPREQFKRALESELDLPDDLVELVVSRYDSWEGLARGVDQLDGKAGDTAGHEQLCRVLIREHKRMHPRSGRMTEKDIGTHVKRLFDYVIDASVVWTA